LAIKLILLPNLIFKKLEQSLSGSNAITFAPKFRAGLILLPRFAPTSIKVSPFFKN
jgi:hypothetical protein